MAEARQIARVSQNTLYRDVQGEAVLLNLDTGEYFGLDEVGTRIWHLIVEKGDLGAVEAAMLEEFAVEAPVLATDLRRIVGELVAKRLLEVEPAPTRSTP
jgi:Coenzyme PQQ synthesis protein D (PqqD)